MNNTGASLDTITRRCRSYLQQLSNRALHQGARAARGCRRRAFLSNMLGRCARLLQNTQYTNIFITLRHISISVTVFQCHRVRIVGWYGRGNREWRRRGWRHPRWYPSSRCCHSNIVHIPIVHFVISGFFDQSL